MNKEMKRSIILDHYQNPYHRIRHDEDDSYVKVNSRNVSCIDNIDLYIKMKDDKIEDISFDGEACVVSISSTSVMSQLLSGKTIDEAIQIIQEFDHMIEEEDFDDKLLGDANVYDDVAKQPSRKKCATLSWHGIYKKLREMKKTDLVDQGVTKEL